MAFKTICATQTESWPASRPMAEPSLNRDPNQLAYERHCCEATPLAIAHDFVT
jgi:hypothetical protein